ncbi:MAG TPA: SAM-dependent methyltransferase [Opitutaceae bacterium]|jgi:SAM-dependent MidA family methyltransferase|nr:SAM-dependent methyltransferase [Opitutaceae bacterium]
MGSSLQFTDLFRDRAGPAGTMTFARFMQLALYDPSFGYYRQPRRRVGRAPGTDFFTASSSPLFGELVAAACASLLAAHNKHPRDFTFVEIGAEPFDSAQGRPGTGILANTPHPFGATKTFRLGDALELDGRCVVFSNELFDAQPFNRFVFRRGAWRELGVTLRDGALAQVEMPALSNAEGPAPSGSTGLTGAIVEGLPVTAPEGYRIDATLEAAALAAKIAGQPWSGLFLAFDYGKSWDELTAATPAGTARAYFRHAQSNDLLARPGEQDLTCHVCWDWLAAALARHGFATTRVESQESFFVHHAADFLASTTSAEAGRFSEKKLELMQLLHPAHLGQKFQALHAWRD